MCIRDRLAPTPTVAAQVLVCEKLPLVEMLEIVKISVPVFMRVTTWPALVVLPKYRLAGERVTAGAVPVPLRAII